jgi:hypothetical protein
MGLTPGVPLADDNAPRTDLRRIAPCPKNIFSAGAGVNFAVIAMVLFIAGCGALLIIAV